MSLVTLHSWFISLEFLSSFILLLLLFHNYLPLSTNFYLLHLLTWWLILGTIKEEINVGEQQQQLIVNLKLIGVGYMNHFSPITIQLWLKSIIHQDPEIIILWYYLYLRHFNLFFFSFLLLPSMLLNFVMWCSMLERWTWQCWTN